MPRSLQLVVLFMLSGVFVYLILNHPSTRQNASPSSEAALALPAIEVQPAEAADYIECYDFQWASRDTLRFKVKFKKKFTPSAILSYEAFSSDGVVLDSGSIGEWLAGNNDGRSWEKEIWLSGDTAPRTRRVALLYSPRF
jgi:hypothetical protein